MQFSESWLRQFVDPALSTQELSHVLTMSGLEVEETKTLAPPFKQVVVAQILEATQHPDADRLKVCQVSVGESSEPLQIVCGAPNARAGIKIPCALVGAELPAASAQDKPFLIRVGKLRGVQSYGMLCSGRELGLGDDHAGILELPQDAPLGTDIREYLGLDDTIFTIKLTPNKADCLSVAGIAREVAALTNAPAEVVSGIANIEKWMPPENGISLDPLETLSAVYWTVVHAKDALDAYKIACELGGDTDTVAALAAGLFAARDPINSKLFDISWMQEVLWSEIDQLGAAMKVLINHRIKAKS